MQTETEQVNKNLLSIAGRPANLPPLKGRFLPLKGIYNFRDLGGYPGQDGRRTKWGLLYRSGHLAHSTPHDREIISQLDIRTLVDFRSDQERKREPDHLPADHGIQRLTLPIQQNGQAPLSSEIRELIKKRALNGLDPSSKMRQMYTMLASDYTEEYKEFFQALLAADGSPVLWHCSAGKDRAGFAAALLLKILGVPGDTILEDYLLSQGNSVPLGLKFYSIALLRGLEAARFVRRMNGVDMSWLETAFKTIEDTWGYFDIYRSEVLELSQSDIDRLRSIYLD